MTYQEHFKQTHWEKTFKYMGIAVWLIALVKFDLGLLGISIMFLIFSFISKELNCAIAERKWIWDMNRGPSALTKSRTFYNKKTGESKHYIWVGDEEGYYKGPYDKKYDYFLNEIK